MAKGPTSACAEAKARNDTIEPPLAVNTALVPELAGLYDGRLSPDLSKRGLRATLALPKLLPITQGAENDKA